MLSQKTERLIAELNPIDTSMFVCDDAVSVFVEAEMVEVGGKYLFVYDQPVNTNNSSQS
jgi:hypothetical protein